MRPRNDTLWRSKRLGARVLKSAKGCLPPPLSLSPSAHPLSLRSREDFPITEMECATRGRNGLRENRATPKEREGEREREREREKEKEKSVGGGGGDGSDGEVTSGPTGF